MDESNVQVTKGGPAPGERGAVRTPCVDIYEKEDELVVVAEMPAVEPDSAQVEVEKGVLAIRGRAAPLELSGFNLLYEGMSSGGGEFFRAFALSDEVDRDRIRATLKDGVLTVVLPKAPQAQTKRITVEQGP